MLDIPVAADVATPKATPPSPWAASTVARPDNATVAKTGPDTEIQSRRIRFTYSDPSGSTRGSSDGDADSTMGILDPELLDAASSMNIGTTDDGSFAFPDISAIQSNGAKSKKLPKPESEDEVFKVPLALPPKTRQALGLPAGLMLPTLSANVTTDSQFDSVWSTDVSAANQSSFNWDKVANKQDKKAGEDGSIVNSSAHSRVSPQLQDTAVDKLRFSEVNCEDSFATGQFSARSTSIGGSNESEARTRDERFSDFGSAFSSSNRSGDLNVRPAVVFGDGDFAGSNRQSFADEYDVGQFQSEGALAMMDAAEKDFEDSNKLMMPGGNGDVSCAKSDGFSPENVSLSSASKSDLLSASAYFKMNTSNVGSLETSYSGRPNLGLSTLKSPRRSKPSLGSIPESDSKNSTYTLSPSDESSSTVKASSNPEPDLGKILDKFSGHSRLELVDIMTKAAPNADAEYYIDLLQKLGHGKQVPASQEQVSTSPYLPSFLETSSADSTLHAQTPQKDSQQHAESSAAVQILGSIKSLEKRTPSPEPPRSRIPRPSPTHPDAKKRSVSPHSTAIKSGKSQIPILSSKGQDTTSTTVFDRSSSSSTKTVRKAQRFSSPIKSSPVQVVAMVPARKKILLPETEKENERSVLPQQSIGKTSRSALKDVSKAELNQLPKKGVPVGAVAVKKKAEFPLASDKSSLIWPAVAVGRSEEQVVTLRNTTRKDVNVKLMIRESQAFKIGVSSCVQVTIAALSDYIVAVMFSPSSTGLHFGKLVMKPQGTEGAAVKASIRLHGQGGISDMQLRNCGHMVNGRRSVDFGQVQHGSLLSYTVKVSNEGNSAGFFAFQGFRDSDCRQKDDGYISAQPMSGVLSGGCHANVKITVDLSLAESGVSPSRGQYLGSLAIFHGPEQCRQVMRSVKHLPGAPRMSLQPFLLGVDLARKFEGEEKAEWDGAVGVHDLDHFYHKTTKEIVDFAGLIKAGAKEFKTLAVEDTLSESRINCTVMHQTMAQANFEAIPEEVPYSRPQSTAGTETTRPPSPRPKTVYLDADQVYFPKTRVGRNSICKVKIKNRTSANQCVRVGQLSPPFSVKHDQVTVKANSFLSLPVGYRPVRAGANDRAVLELTTPQQVQMLVNLHGKCAGCDN